MFNVRKKKATLTPQKNKGILLMKLSKEIVFLYLIVHFVLFFSLLIMKFYTFLEILMS